MIYPLHCPNTKKLKKTKTADFLVNTGILVKLFQKKAKINNFRKKSKNNNIILGFGYWVFEFGFS